MRRVHLWCSVPVVLLLAIAPSATAQVFATTPAEGSVDIEVEDPAVVLWGDNGTRNVEVRVAGSIQCDGGGDPPEPVEVLTGVPTDPAGPFWVDQAERSVDWASGAGEGEWAISERVTFGFGTSIESDNRTTTRSGVFLVRHTTQEEACTASGYRIAGDRDQFTLIARPLAAADETEAPVIPAGDVASPFLFLLIGATVGALVTWLFAVRIRRPPSMGAESEVL